MPPCMDLPSAHSTHMQECEDAALAIKFGTGITHSSRSDFASTAGGTEATMSQSKSLQIRRLKQKGKKHPKNLAKQAKKLKRKKAH